MARHTTILAHRGNINGPGPRENTLSSVRSALEHGWGIETDLRRESQGRFYISHDLHARPASRSADAFCSLFRQFPHATIALNLKETGAEAELVAYLEEQRVIDQVFLFDMELIEEVPGHTAQHIRSLHPTVRLAARVSDRHEPVARALDIESASVIWVDEFEDLWCTKDDIRALKDAGRTVYAVSPELHNYPLRMVPDRWRDFIKWGVDGICTDYPAALDEMLVELGHLEAA
jgi:glycerophosphoryl diester phosphodiesterase